MQQSRERRNAYVDTQQTPTRQSAQGRLQLRNTMKILGVIISVFTVFIMSTPIKKNNTAADYGYQYEDADPVYEYEGYEYEYEEDQLLEQHWQELIKEVDLEEISRDDYWRRLVKEKNSKDKFTQDDIPRDDINLDSLPPTITENKHWQRLEEDLINKTGASEQQQDTLTLFLPLILKLSERLLPVLLKFIEASNTGGVTSSFRD